MSNLLNTTAMVAELQTRVPIGLSSAFWGKKLNEAYRWISQKGNFIWDVKGTDINLAAYATFFPIPSDCDPGKPMYLVGPIGLLGFSDPITLDSIVPYVSWDDAGLQKFSEMSIVPGMVSCWTFRTNFSAGPPPVYSYRGYIFPADALNDAASFRFVYHTDVSSTEFAVSATQYFPTPNSFDNLIIELAEAEARRIYGLAGWEIIQKRAETGIMNLLDSYRSTKNVLAGLIDQQKQSGERKLMAQERS